MKSTQIASPEDQAQSSAARLQPSESLRAGLGAKEHRPTPGPAAALAQSPRMAAQRQAMRAAFGPVAGGAAGTATLPVHQLVKAYRVEYQHNRKVIASEKGVTGLTAPIDISYVMPDHSDYFASERSQDQLVGLRRVQWEMDDDWWDAAYYMAKSGKKPSGKAATKLEAMKADSLPKPTWSDGASITKFVKQTALHFQAQWQDSLNSAIVKGSGSVEDLEAEIRAELAEKEAKKKAAAEAKRKRTDLVSIHVASQANSEMDVTYGEFLDSWQDEGYSLAP